ncbi:MAG: hypothetical protein ACRETY_10655 [Steroidobacteraceae bacterium]
MTDPQNSPPKGYGNIYTPHAGSMVIQVQREGGLANRTITLSSRQVRLLKYGWRTLAGMLLVGIASWIFFAVQAARVPFLTRRLSQMQTDLKRVDTLRTQLEEMERHFNQVQRMLSAPSATSNGSGRASGDFARAEPPAATVSAAVNPPTTRRNRRRAASAVDSASRDSVKAVAPAPPSPDSTGGHE